MKYEPTKLIEYQGENKSAGQWAKQLGMSRRALVNRLIKVEEGKLTLDEAFTPIVKPTVKPPADKQAVDPNHPIRLRLQLQFYQHIEEKVMPHLGTELDEYRRTGKKGHCMQLLKDFAGYLFPKDRSELLDGAVDAKTVASMVMIVNPTTCDPSTVKVIETY